MHDQAASQNEQDDTGGDVDLTDVEAQEIVQDLTEASLQRNQITDAVAAHGPLDLAAGEGSTEPDDAHQEDGGVADVGGDGHFAALDHVQDLAVAHADEPCHNSGNQDSKNQRGPGTETGQDAVHQRSDVEFHGQQHAQQAADDAQGDTEVRADAALDGGHHSQNQNAPHTPVLQGGGEIGSNVNIIDSCGNNDGDEEQEHDQAGNADDVQYLLDLFFGHDY